MDLKLGLVLEGGGMRGVFTTGVLDSFMERGLEFPYVIGASAGGSNGLSYASRQKGRAHFCNIDILRKRNYIGWRYMFTQGCVMDYDFMFGALPREVYPYDFDAYRRNGKYVLVATNCLTGKPEYFEKSDSLNELLTACRASCSLPFLCTMTRINGVPYLDGGITDSVPIKRAVADGFSKCVVILTRHAGYRKRERLGVPARVVYRKYPLLAASIARRSENYNASLEFLEDMEARGDALVIRPKEDMKVGRLGAPIDVLENLYREGLECGKKCIAKIAALETC